MQNSEIDWDQVNEDSFYADQAIEEEHQVCGSCDGSGWDDSEGGVCFSCDGSGCIC